MSSWKLPPPQHTPQQKAPANPKVLKFLLTGGHFVFVVYDDGHARAVLKKWLEGGYGPGEKIGAAADVYPWGLDSAHVIGIQMFDPKDMQQQQQAMQGNRIYGSGLN